MSDFNIKKYLAENRQHGSPEQIAQDMLDSGMTATSDGNFYSLFAQYMTRYGETNTNINDLRTRTMHVYKELLRKQWKDTPSAQRGRPQGKPVNEVFYGKGDQGYKLYGVNDLIYSRLESWGVQRDALTAYDPAEETATIVFDGGITDEIDRSMDYFKSNWQVQATTLRQDQIDDDGSVLPMGHETYGDEEFGLDEQGDMFTNQLSQLKEYAGITEAPDLRDDLQKARDSYNAGHADGIANNGEDMSWLKVTWGPYGDEYKQGYANAQRDLIASGKDQHANDSHDMSVDETAPQGKAPGAQVKGNENVGGKRGVLRYDQDHKMSGRLVGEANGDEYDDMEFGDGRPSGYEGDNSSAEDTIALMKQEAEDGYADGFWHIWWSEAGREAAVELWGEDNAYMIDGLTKEYEETDAALTAVEYFDSLEKQHTEEGIQGDSEIVKMRGNAGILTEPTTEATDDREDIFRQAMNWEDDIEDIDHSSNPFSNHDENMRRNDDVNDMMSNKYHPDHGLEDPFNLEEDLLGEYNDWEDDEDEDDYEDEYEGDTSVTISGKQPANSYWEHSGKYQDKIEPLEALLPTQDEVEDYENNPMLERFRQGANVYYDIYNNGLWNEGRGQRGEEFEELFDLGPGQNIDTTDLEELIDETVKEAWIEQEAKGTVQSVAMDEAAGTMFNGDMGTDTLVSSGQTVQIDSGEATVVAQRAGYIVVKMPNGEMKGLRDDQWWIHDDEYAELDEDNSLIKKAGKWDKLKEDEAQVMPQHAQDDRQNVFFSKMGKVNEAVNSRYRPGTHNAAIDKSSFKRQEMQHELGHEDEAIRRQAAQARINPRTGHRISHVRYDDDIDEGNMIDDWPGAGESNAENIVADMIEFETRAVSEEHFDEIYDNYMDGQADIYDPDLRAEVMSLYKKHIRQAGIREAGQTRTYGPNAPLQKPFGGFSRMKTQDLKNWIKKAKAEYKTSKDPEVKNWIQNAGSALAGKQAPRAPSTKYKYTIAKQVGGDDGYQWAVMDKATGRVFINGLTKPEVKHYRDRAEAELAKKAGVNEGAQNFSSWSVSKLEAWLKQNDSDEPGMGGTFAGQLKSARKALAQKRKAVKEGVNETEEWSLGARDHRNQSYRPAINPNTKKPYTRQEWEDGKKPANARDVEEAIIPWDSEHSEGDFVDDESGQVHRADDVIMDPETGERREKTQQERMGPEAWAEFEREEAELRAELDAEYARWDDEEDEPVKLKRVGWDAIGDFGDVAGGGGDPIDFIMQKYGFSMEDIDAAAVEQGYADAYEWTDSYTTLPGGVNSEEDMEEGASTFKKGSKNKGGGYNKPGSSKEKKASSKRSRQGDKEILQVNEIETATDQLASDRGEQELGNAVAPEVDGDAELAGMKQLIQNVIGEPNQDMETAIQDIANPEDEMDQQLQGDEVMQLRNLLGMFK